MKNKYLKYGAIALGAIVLILLAIPLFINANSFRPAIEKQLTEALGRKVQVGNLSLSIFSGSFSADDFSIADDPKFSNKPFLTAKSFQVGIEVMPLITSKTLNVTGLTIEKPELNLVRDQQGVWNFSTLGSGASGAAPAQAQTPATCARIPDRQARTERWTRHHYVPGLEQAKRVRKRERNTVESLGQDPVPRRADGQSAWRRHLQTGRQYRPVESGRLYADSAGYEGHHQRARPRQVGVFRCWLGNGWAG